MARVERETVALADSVVPVGLHFVDVVGYEACSVRFFVLGWVQGNLLLVPDGTLGLGCSERGAFEVEAEERVDEEIVQRRPGAIPVVG